MAANQRPEATRLWKACQQ